MGRAQRSRVRTSLQGVLDPIPDRSLIAAVDEIGPDTVRSSFVRYAVSACCSHDQLGEFPRLPPGARELVEVNR